MSDRLQAVFSKIEENQKEDPNTLVINGTTLPKELCYGQRMIEMLEEYESNPPEALQIAAKGQHIRRWEIPRDSYPKDRKGYLKWRTQEKLMHGKLLSDIMSEVGYDEEMRNRVNDLVTKKKLNKDEETQKLEDVVCLVFLKYYFGEFAQEHPREKIIHILQKTWGKMTEKGHQMVMQLQLGTQEKELVNEALA